MPRNKFTLLFLLLTCGTGAFAQTRTESAILRQAGITQAAKEKALHEKLQRLAKEKSWPLTRTAKNGGLAALVDVDFYGNPVYVATDNNIRAAATIGTNQLWPGGSTGLSLSGSSTGLTNKVALWDGGSVLSTHVELTGRITNREQVSNNDHSTHVAGTIMATGVNPLAKGMAYQLPKLLVYDFNNHLSEMLNISSSLLISNHSYGVLSGWSYNDEQNRWEYYGPVNSTEDYKFGYYSSEAEVWDSIAYNAPEYLIVKSAGNSRSENGPSVGAKYWRYNSNNQMVEATRTADMSSNNSYDIIPTYGTAKNVLTIGAVDPLPSGYTRASDVVLADFSSWGPTDDGRIKPDVVANGVDLLSSIASSNTAYASYSGTSMATPNAAGSLVLLQEYYAKLHGGSFMRSATLKGIVIHTADEAGPADGPDYQFGWGLINMQRAAAVITADNTVARTQRIEQNVLNNGDNYTLNVVASGSGSLIATICWTDPKAVAIAGTPLNNATPRLINDLDIRITDGTHTYTPWILTPAVPSAAATHGDNVLDNVEKIEIPDAVPGVTYTITVSHKNTLARGSQAYSLIVSGIGGANYQSSGASNSGGTRIDSVSFGNIQKLNPAGCTTYTDFTDLTADVEPNSTLPLYIRLNSCDASSAARIVKAYIDFNSDGDFNDADELVATSGPVAGGTQSFTQTITIPAGVSVNNYTLLRIVAQETSNAADVQPTGQYPKGETQDYRIHIISPSNDVGVIDVVSPLSGSCAATGQYVTVRLRNFGTVNKWDIPISLTVTDGATTVLSTTGIYPDTLTAREEVNFTFQTPFTSVAGTTYTVTSGTTLAGDQLLSNNQKTAAIVITAASGAPAGQAEICGNEVHFSATNFSEGDVPYWYETAASTTPIAAGTLATSTVITANKQYYLAKNISDVSAGPKTSTSLGTPAYAKLASYFINFTNNVPVVIDNVRLFIGQGNATGKVTVIVGRNLSFNASESSYTYTQVSSTEVNIYPTGTGGAVFNLNLPVPTTGNHVLILSGGGDATFAYNRNLAANPYPMGVNGVFTVTGNVQQYVNNDAAKYYFIFYDLKVRTANCASSGRTAVTAVNAVAPTASIDGNLLSSSSATGNQWYLNNNPITGATGQTYTASAVGAYKVIVTDAFGCGLPSNEIQYAVTSTPNVDPAEIGLKIYPNPPSNGQFVADFTVTSRADLSISILSVVGQKVYERIYPGFTGRFNRTIMTGPLPQGVYLLRIQHNNKSYLKKLFIK